MIDRSRIADLGTAEVCSAAVDARRDADRAAADLLVLAAHFADLHPVTAGMERAAHGDPTLRVAASDGGNLGVERLAPLAGEGTPEVAEFAPEELGAALGLRGEAAKGLIGHALELRHRLPRLWSLVLGGKLQAWKARQVADETIPLCPAAAAFVDRHLAVAAAKNRIPHLKALIHEALIQCDPESAAGREQAALDRRGVWSDHRESTATTRISIVADTLDALAFEDTIADLATGLGRLGDPDPLDVRRARAVGVIADPQRSLDLLTGRATAPDGTAAGTAVAPATHGNPTGAGKVGVLLHLHYHPPHATRDHAAGSSARAEGLGALTLELLQEWLDRADRVIVQPVLDLRRDEAVDGHEPAEWMREAVILRDGCCVFPGCTRNARACDLDHVVPYVPLDQGGPPGQTHPSALAALCRRHHRVKTHGRWRYRRNPDDSYTWTSPHGATYTVDPGDHGGTRHPPDRAA